MTFEGKLARRYICAQKRHSLLTICSITIAVAMMTMLFVLVQTLFASEREHIVQTQFPHHFILVSEHAFTQEETDVLRAQSAVADCGIFDPRDYYTFRKARDGQTRFAEDSLAHSAYNRYYGWLEYSENVREDYREKGIIHIPDEGALPMWVDFRFQLKETDTAQFDALKAALGERTDYQVLINDELTTFDMIGMGGKFRMAMIFAAIYVLVVLLALCLRMVIDTAFEISSKERERQFGVLQSVGATKRQIIRIITQEGFTLSAVGIPAGLLLGLGFAYLTYRAVLSTDSVYWAWGEAGLADVRFHAGWFALAVSAFTGLMWVFFSAYATGLRMVKKKAPIEAVRSSQSKINKVRKHSLSGLLFGWVGSLAARNVRRNKKRYAVTVLSLSVSITLIATVGYAADSYLHINEMLIETEHWPDNLSYDYRVDGIADDYGIEAAKKLQKKLEDSGYYSYVRMNPYGGGLLNLSEVIDPENIPEAAKDQIKERQRDEEGNLKPLSNDTMIGYSFLDEQDYTALFGENPAISYQQLSEQNGFLIVSNDNSPGELPVHDGILTLSVAKCVPLTDERRAELEAEFYQTHDPDEEPYFFDVTRPFNAEAEAAMQENPEEYYTRRSEYYRQDSEYIKQVFNMNIVGTQAYTPKAAEKQGNLPWGMGLVSTMDYYEREYAPEYDTITAACGFYVNLKDRESYEPSLEWLRGEPQLTLDECNNLFPEYRKAESSTEAVKMAIRMLYILISLIAAVSMINVISTGILNRRAEIAGMRSVGMTKKQLNRLILTECAQFVIGGILGAVVITCGAVYGMRVLVSEAGLPELIRQLDLRFTKPLPAILIAGACAFTVAVAAAMLPLKRIKEEPIVDSLRSID